MQRHWNSVSTAWSVEAYPWGLYDADTGVDVRSCGPLNSEAMYAEEPAKLSSALFFWCGTSRFNTCWIE